MTTTRAKENVILDRCMLLLRRGWCQAKAATTREGKVVSPDHRTASCWCATGAVDGVIERMRMTTHQKRIYSGLVIIRLARHLPEEFHSDPHWNRVMRWNDHPERTRAQVLALFRKARKS